MRIAILFAPLALSACGLMQSAPDVPFAAIKGRVVTVKEECALSFPDGKGGSSGPCNQILPRSRTQENRAATLQRKLAITYAYTAPVDGQIYQGKGDILQPMSTRVPRAGDPLDVMAHPEQATVTRLR